MILKEKQLEAHLDVPNGITQFLSSDAANVPQTCSSKFEPILRRIVFQAIRKEEICKLGDVLRVIRYLCQQNESKGIRFLFAAGLTGILDKFVLYICELVIETKIPGYEVLFRLFVEVLTTIVPLLTDNYVWFVSNIVHFITILFKCYLRLPITHLLVDSINDIVGALPLEVVYKIRSLVCSSKAMQSMCKHMLCELYQLGDYQVQIAIIEMIVRFVPGGVRKENSYEWNNKDISLATCFNNITYNEFDQTTRIYLNEVNKQKNSRIVSYRITKVTIGELTFNGDSQSWVDICARSKRLTVSFCLTDDKSSNVQVCEWFDAENVSSYLIEDNTGTNSVAITINSKLPLKEVFDEDTITDDCNAMVIYLAKVNRLTAKTLNSMLEPLLGGLQNNTQIVQPCARLSMPMSGNIACNMSDPSHRTKTVETSQNMVPTSQPEMRKESKPCVAGQAGENGNRSAGRQTRKLQLYKVPVASATKAPKDDKSKQNTTTSSHNVSFQGVSSSFKSSRPSTCFAFGNASQVIPETQYHNISRELNDSNNLHLSQLYNGVSGTASKSMEGGNHRNSAVATSQDAKSVSSTEKVGNVSLQSLRSPHVVCDPNHISNYLNNSHNHSRSNDDRRLKTVKSLLSQNDNASLLSATDKSALKLSAPTNHASAGKASAKSNSGILSHPTTIEDTLKLSKKSPPKLVKHSEAHASSTTASQAQVEVLRSNPPVEKRILRSSKVVKSDKNSSSFFTRRKKPVTRKNNSKKTKQRISMVQEEVTDSKTKSSDDTLSTNRKREIAEKVKSQFKNLEETLLSPSPKKKQPKVVPCGVNPFDTSTTSDETDPPVLHTLNGTKQKPLKNKNNKEVTDSKTKSSDDTLSTNRKREIAEKVKSQFKNLEETLLSPFPKKKQPKVVPCGVNPFDTSTTSDETDPPVLHTLNGTKQKPLKNKNNKNQTSKKAVVPTEFVKEATVIDDEISRKQKKVTNMAIKKLGVKAKPRLSAKEAADKLLLDDWQFSDDPNTADDFPEVFRRGKSYNDDIPLGFNALSETSIGKSSISDIDVILSDDDDTISEISQPRKTKRARVSFKSCKDGDSDEETSKKEPKRRKRTKKERLFDTDGTSSAASTGTDLSWIQAYKKSLDDATVQLEPLKKISIKTYQPKRKQRIGDELGIVRVKSKKEEDAFKPKPINQSLNETLSSPELARDHPKNFKSRCTNPPKGVPDIARLSHSFAEIVEAVEKNEDKEKNSSVESLAMDIPNSQCSHISSVKTPMPSSKDCNNRKWDLRRVKIKQGEEKKDEDGEEEDENAKDVPQVSAEQEASKDVAHKNYVNSSTNTPIDPRCLLEDGDEMIIRGHLPRDDTKKMSLQEVPSIGSSSDESEEEEEEEEEKKDAAPARRMSENADKTPKKNNTPQNERAECEGNLPRKCILQNIKVHSNESSSEESDEEEDNSEKKDTTPNDSNSCFNEEMQRKNNTTPKDGKCPYVENSKRNAKSRKRVICREESSSEESEEDDDDEDEEQKTRKTVRFPKRLTFSRSNVDRAYGRPLTEFNSSINLDDEPDDIDRVTPCIQQFINEIGKASGSSQANCDEPLKNVYRLLEQNLEDVRKIWTQHSKERNDNLTDFQEQMATVSERHLSLMNKIQSLEENVRKYILQFQHDLNAALGECSSSLSEVKNIQKSLCRAQQGNHTKLDTAISKVSDQILADLQSIMKGVRF